MSDTVQVQIQTDVDTAWSRMSNVEWTNTEMIYLFIDTIFIEETQLAKITILPCGPLKHITK